MTAPETSNALNMMNNSPEVIIADSDANEVSCDGGSGALGHPQVWYSFDGRDRVVCGYCDREFVKRTS